MEKMLAFLSIQGLIALTVTLIIVIAILALVIIILSLKINKMIKEAENLEKKYERKVSIIKESLDDCKAQMRKLEQQKEEAEEAAKNYKAQRDFTIKFKKLEESAENPETGASPE